MDLRCGGNALLFIAERYKSDRTMALTAVRHQGRMLKLHGAKFRDDEEVVRAARRNTPRRNTPLRHDWDLNFKAVLHHEGAFSAVHESLSTHRAFCLACVRQDGHVLMAEPYEWNSPSWGLSRLLFRQILFAICGRTA